MSDPESVIHNSKVQGSTAVLVNNKQEDNYNLKIFRYSLNLIAHLLIGAVVAITVLFVVTFEFQQVPSSPLHIMMCVIGYQLLMAEAILSMSNDSGWATALKIMDKKRAHWILQVLGSVIALIGCFVKVLDEETHWTTLHGQFALVAMVFTVASLVNGLTSLYAHELRRFLPGSLSKITHICFGVVAFVSASISLCYGFRKNSFTTWSSEEMVIITISFVAALTFIVIINPMMKFYERSISLFRK